MLGLWIPYKDFSFADALNSTCASQGSYRAAVAAHGADYKGHSVTIDWCRDSYWRAYYTYNGINVIARGDFNEVVRAAKAFHDRSGRHGASVSIYSSDAERLTPEERRLATDLGFEPCSNEIEKARYREICARDWRIDYIADALWLEKHMQVPAIMWLTQAKTLEEYKDKTIPKAEAL